VSQYLPSPAGRGEGVRVALSKTIYIFSESPTAILGGCPKTPAIIGSMPNWFRGVYAILWALALPFAFARLWWRGRKNPAYREHWNERLGRRGTASPPDVWIHAVSVGEARATLPIVNSLLKTEQRVLITCTTPTGRATLRELYGNKLSIRYLPFDAPWLVGSFLKRVGPRVGVLMETEVWPGLCDGAYRLGIPLWLVNGRMSERSLKGYLRGRGLTQAMFATLYGVAAQTAKHAERFTQLGAHNVHVVGNLKFDIDVPEHLQKRADAMTEHLTGGVASTAYWVAGSTREGEESMFLHALVKHPLRHRALAVIVPRHPERWQSTYSLAEKLGFNVAKRSDAVIPSGCEVIVGDSMGEMLSYYANAKVVAMGGTYGGTGGQNLIEPCAVGVPVVLGPSRYNFQQAADEALAAGAAKNARDAREALTVVLEFLDDEFHRKRVGAKAREFVAAHQGATEKTLGLIRVTE
jgi:3-deoxy-D-manno-octulosonic-acid transferase